MIGTVDMVKAIVIMRVDIIMTETMTAMVMPDIMEITDNQIIGGNCIQESDS